MAKKVGGGGAIMQPYDENGEYDFNGAEVEKVPDFKPKAKKNPKSLDIKVDIPSKKHTVKNTTLKTRQDIEAWSAMTGVDVKSVYSELDEQIANEQMSKYIELFDKFPIRGEGNLFVQAKTLSVDAIAQADYKYQSGEIGISLNTSCYKAKSFTTNIEKFVKSGWFCSVDEENYKYQSITHEYGHCIEYYFLSKNGYKEKVEERLRELKNKAYLDYKILKNYKKEQAKIIKQTRQELFYNKIFPEIFKKAKEYDSSLTIPRSITTNGFKTAPQISQYGTTSWAEYFAESFSNGLNGKPSAIGRATIEILKNLFKGV